MYVHNSLQIFFVCPDLRKATGPAVIHTIVLFLRLGVITNNISITEQYDNLILNENVEINLLDVPGPIQNVFKSNHLLKKNFLSI